MAEITEKELKKQIANGMFSPVYLLYGEEAFLKQYYAGLIAEKSVAKGFETFNLHKLEGKETSLDEIADAAEQLPMMAERTCVLVRDFDLKALKGAQREKLEAFLSNPPGTCSVVFWMDTVEVAPKQNKDWQGIIKLFAKSGAAVRLSRRTSVELTRQLCASAKKRGGSLPLEAASYLVAYSGSDLNLLIKSSINSAPMRRGGRLRKGISTPCALKAWRQRPLIWSKHFCAVNMPMPTGCWMRYLRRKRSRL